jgi:hypothetical protein
VCRCKLRRRAAVALAQGLRTNRTLRQLNLAGVKGLDEAGAVALAGAVSCSKALTALNLAFVKLSEDAVGALIEVSCLGRLCHFVHSLQPAPVCCLLHGIVMRWNSCVQVVRVGVVFECTS